LHDRVGAAELRPELVVVRQVLEELADELVDLRLVSEVRHPTSIQGLSCGFWPIGGRGGKPP